MASEIVIRNGVVPENQFPASVNISRASAAHTISKETAILDEKEVVSPKPCRIIKLIVSESSSKSLDRYLEVARIDIAMIHDAPNTTDDYCACSRPNYINVVDANQAR